MKYSQPRWRLQILRNVALLVLLFCPPAFASNEVDYNHWISDKSEHGALIVLEDGTVWAVDPVDRVKTSIWLTVDHVALVKSPSTPKYPVLMIDEREEERVHVKYIGEI
jgi:hypothetical protein